MLNMSQFLGSNVAENTVSINGATFKVTDEVAMSIIAIIGGKSTVSTNKVSSNRTSTVKSSTTPKKKYKIATDYDIPYSLEKNVMHFTANIPRDAYKVISNELGTQGINWDKTVKGFVFKTQKACKDYSIRRTKVTSEERESIRKEWNNN